MVTSMPFLASFSVGFFHAIQILFQILDTGGLFPHQGKHFGERVGVSLRVDVNPGGNHISHSLDEGAVGHQILLGTIIFGVGGRIGSCASVH